MSSGACSPNSSQTRGKTMATKAEETGSEAVKPKRRNGVHTEGTDVSAEADSGREELDEISIKPAEIVEQVTTFTKHNPHIALAGAAAVGFVLGGGLSPRLVGAV